MAVLAEAISVVVRCDAILQRLPGGEEAFQSMVTNDTYCSDGHLVRVGFLGPAPVEAFVHELEAAGLRYLVDGKATDFVVVDQHHGPTTPCDWIEFARIPFGPDQRVAACWLYEGPRLPMAGIHLGGGLSMQLFTPERWRFEGSITEKGTFLSHQELAERMVLLRVEGDRAVYLDTHTGREVYSSPPGNAEG
jgi:hypothetical protein